MGAGGLARRPRDEAARLRWAGRYVTVAEVLSLEQHEDGSLLVTAALAGDNAVAARWRADPGPAVAALGQGLRSLHDRLPVEDCPYTWSVEERLGWVDGQARRGLLDPGPWSPTMSVAEVLAELHDPPPADRLVVCHGDPCTPNTILDDHGGFVGHVDMGSLGVADRWADLAVATWATVWNYGSGWEDVLLAAYGADPDPRRTRYYRMLWALGP